MSDEEKKEETTTVGDASSAKPDGEPAPQPEPEKEPEPKGVGQKKPVPAGPIEPERAESASEDKGGQQAARTAAKAQADADYRAAKAQLKAARKHAGKSNAPKVVGGILLGLVLVAGGAAAGWFSAHQWGEEQIGQLESQLSSTQQQLNQANDQVSATTSILNGGSRAYAGSWNGELISTLGAATKRCYGASGKQMTLNIDDISVTGQMELSVGLLYHGHETATLPNDEKSDAGDAMVKSGQITSTFSSKSFTFRVDAGKDGNYAVVTVSPTTSADAHIQLGVVVESYYRDALVETDQYLLKKKGDTSSASENAVASSEESTAESAAESSAQSSEESSAENGVSSSDGSSEEGSAASSAAASQESPASSSSDSSAESSAESSARSAG